MHPLAYVGCTMPKTFKLIRSVAWSTFVTLLALSTAACARERAPSAAEHVAPARREETRRVRSTDGVELAVTEVGPPSAPAIVFLHGLGFSREVWHRQLDGALASRFHLVAFDLRGHGQSSRPADQAAYSDGARWGDDLAAVLEATRAVRPVVVGWSLGGLVIATYLRDHGGEALAGAVFVDAVTKFAPELFTAENGPLLEDLDAPDEDVRRKATRAFVEACFVTPIEPAELDGLLKSAGVLPPDEQRAIQRISIDGVEQALRDFRKPALVIHGRADRMLNEAMARYTASTVSGARFALYERSGHAPFIDETPRFDDELTRFAERVQK